MPCKTVLAHCMYYMQCGTCTCGVLAHAVKQQTRNFHQSLSSVTRIPCPWYLLCVPPFMCMCVCVCCVCLCISMQCSVFAENMRTSMCVLAHSGGTHCRNNVLVAVAQAGAVHWRQCLCHGVIFAGCWRHRHESHRSENDRWCPSHNIRNQKERKTETCGRSGGQWSTNCRATATVAKYLIQHWVGG